MKSIKVDDCTIAHWRKNGDDIHIELETRDESGEWVNGDFAILTNIDFSEIDESKLAEWIRETYYSLDFLCPANIPSRICGSAFI